MVEIDNLLVAKMNDEVASENVWDVVDKYELETPDHYAFDCLSEHNGIEVWGISIDGDFLVYDEDNGFYLLSEPFWINEVQKFLEENYNFEFGDEISLAGAIEALKECDAELTHISEESIESKFEARIKALEERLPKYPKVSSIQASGELKETLDGYREKDRKKESFEEIVWKLIEQAEKIKELEKENEQLRKRVEELEDENENLNAAIDGMTAFERERAKEVSDGMYKE